MRINKIYILDGGINLKKYTKTIFSLALSFLILSFYILNFGYVAKADTNNVSVTYQGNVQNIGWQNTVQGGTDAGTTGLGLKLEALKINLTNSPTDAHITYKAHVQNVGWQNVAQDGAITGTTGKNLRLEAVEISLKNVPGYSVEYRVHVQNIGWQDWVNSGALAGTTGQGLRIEAIEIKIVPIINATSISLNKNSSALAVGGTDSLTATLSPNNEADNITWASSNSNVASVDDFGDVTGLATGTTIITATTESGVSDSCTYIVNAVPVAVTKLKLSKATDSINLRTADTLTAKITPTNATDTNVSWTSSDPNVATVNKGVVTAINIGVTTITAISEDGSKTDSCIVTIIPIAVTAVKVNKTTDTIAIGGVDVLSAAVTPIYATDANVKWTSSNTKVVTVDTNGLITGVGKGSALVTAISEDNGKTSSCTVTVSANSVTNVTLNEYSEVIIVGNTVTLTATITPDNAENQAVVWTTSDPNVATVSSTGVVTGIKASTTPVIITVTSLDGGFTDACDVTVIN